MAEIVVQTKDLQKAWDALDRATAFVLHIDRAEGMKADINPSVASPLHGMLESARDRIDHILTGVGA